MRLLVTSAAGAYGDGYGSLLAFDRDGMPLDLYSHASETMQVEAAQRLDRLWQKTGIIGPGRSGR